MALMTSAHEKLYEGWIVSECVEVGDGFGDAVGTLVVERVIECFGREGEDGSLADAVWSKFAVRVAGGEAVI